MDRYDLADSWHQESRVNAGVLAVMGGEGSHGVVQSSHVTGCKSFVMSHGLYMSHGVYMMSRGARAKGQESRVRNTHCH